MASQFSWINGLALARLNEWSGGEDRTEHSINIDFSYDPCCSVYRFSSTERLCICFSTLLMCEIMIIFSHFSVHLAGE